MQFLGAILWAYVTARLVDVIVNASPEATRFRQMIDELNRFCFFNKLPKEMEIRLREYYIKRKQITQAESRQEVSTSTTRGSQHTPRPNLAASTHAL